MVIDTAIINAAGNESKTAPFITNFWHFIHYCKYCLEYLM